MLTNILQYDVNPEKVYNKKYLELLNKISRFNARRHPLFGTYPIAGFKYDSDLLIIGRQAPWWPECFSVHELNVKGEENIFYQKVMLPGAYAIRRACPMAFVTDLWGDSKYRPMYKAYKYHTRSDSFWVCAKEIVKGLGISDDENEWPSYLSLSYLYKISFADKPCLNEKLRLLQLDICKDLFKFELYMGKPRRILFLTGMNYAKDFLGLPEDIGLDDCIVNLGVFDYGVHRAETVVSANPKKYFKDGIVDTVLRGFGVTPIDKHQKPRWDTFRRYSKNIKYSKILTPEQIEINSQCA
jgi:hypothetical protein